MYTYIKKQEVIFLQVLLTWFHYTVHCDRQAAYVQYTNMLTHTSQSGEGRLVLHNAVSLSTICSYIHHNQVKGDLYCRIQYHWVLYVHAYRHTPPSDEDILVLQNIVSLSTICSYIHIIVEEKLYYRIQYHPVLNVHIYTYKTVTGLVKCTVECSVIDYYMLTHIKLNCTAEYSIIVNRFHPYQSGVERII